MDVPSRGDLASEYLDQIPFDPYPVQEEALLAWFSTEQGVLVCAPTGTGKTIIAEAALFEALKTGRKAYYTTPLIALTEQKFREMQAAAVRWGFSEEEIGLVTGNRKVNPEASVLVVVAEILLNRLLHPEAFDFSDVFAVVMDEFHSFNDPERGVVWELSLGMLPRHVRLLLLSATVGNTADFLIWLRQSHGRKIDLVQSSERKIPLHFEWVEELLNDHLEQMAQGEDQSRRTPALVFCFNRVECWNVAEQLKGKSLLAGDQKKQLAEQINRWDWKLGAGPKLKQILMRGVGVHHAGMLPRYRRRVEDLFQQKLLSVCVCTETLAAGINLPARSVVLTSLMKGPPGKQKLIDPSSAHQMFGRAGRPQFDDRGFVYALAHEDDVKLARWKQQYDQIPEDSKDPQLIKAKKRLKKKMPKRREGVQYWTEAHFQKLIDSPPGKLASRGHLPHRLLAYLLTLSPEVSRLTSFVDKRLLDEKGQAKAQEQLQRMLMTFWAGGYVELHPPPEGGKPREWFTASLGEAMTEKMTLPDQLSEQDDFGAGLLEEDEDHANAINAAGSLVESPAETESESSPEALGTFGALLQEALAEKEQTVESDRSSIKKGPAKRELTEQQPESETYIPERAYPTERLADLLIFRSVNPVYGRYLIDLLGYANREERIQALESLLELPRSILSQVRVPPPEQLPPGPLARQWLDDQIVTRGLASLDELYPKSFEEEDDPQLRYGGPKRRFAIPFAEKLRMLFNSEYPGVHGIFVTPVWVVGDILRFGGDFQKYVTSRDLTKQEGLIFRHLLRMILLCGEFEQLTPSGTDAGAWQQELAEIADMCTETCRAVDPESTDKMLESMAQQSDLVDLESG